MGKCGTSQISKETVTLKETPLRELFVEELRREGCRLGAVNGQVSPVHAVSLSEIIAVMLGAEHGCGCEDCSTV